ncbi:MAG: glycoside hydrolase family 15 protein [Candidatus Microthrix sp.]|jgi:GH15 family glucan-1,4-alpha-glucosidase|uniref:Glycoside hydrolase family 15 protein n=1 Tax=Candidatus Neomicrothrix subdominans TaxID=2954438 RepID=A0A936NCD7_9ACTN|nr:glycoside hydrolase family 15 protein [Candidatus Microthrix sp.]MBK7163946.1 glycoside hydrolase family 15 protein [Candidatus Microthrix sp.]MBK9297084.1 glycoside hydrolase family 15 protein [Candidatus Microthrix subdominans]MBK9560971.1 glycoside hydrolase family 15 protein [Candidatus Microthrix sp.]
MASRSASCCAPPDVDAVDEAVRGASRPIEDLGMIGDTRTAALVGSDGSIDWMCIPSFDGSPVFGRLVGGVAAGRFRMGPNAPATVIDREYRHETATLRTTWVTDAGRLTLTEAMVSEVAGRFLPTTLLVRRLSAVEGPVEVGIEFDPRLGERHVAPRVERRGDVTVCSWGAEAMALTCSANLDLEPGGTHTVTIEAGEDLTIVVGVADHEPLIYVDPARAWAAVCDDERGWRSWCADIPDDIPHRDTVVRSLLTLRLLTYSPSGAPVAAPTTSLPEDPGGIRNWDYRFAWPRDASIGIGAFLGVGKDDEARHFLAWLLHASRRDRPRLPVLLTLHGRHPRGEGEMTGWPGYANSRPVRVGNGAADQHQLDGYGWVIDAAWLLTAAGHGLYTETWRALRGFVDEVVARWRDPDAGIWEVRGDEAHHVHSKLMAWLALDRALAISATQRTPKRQQDAWRRERAALAADIAAHGYNDVVGAYTRTYGSDDLDAAVLVLPLLGVEPAASERIRSTVAAIRRELGAGGPLVYRYPPGEDGLPGGEGAFLPCSFWLVQALALTGDVSEARSVFDELVAMAGPLGLFAEEVDPETGAFIGNFPQALSHASLVQAALALRGAGSSAS